MSTYYYKDADSNLRTLPIELTPITEEEYKNSLYYCWLHGRATAHESSVDGAPELTREQYEWWQTQHLADYSADYEETLAMERTPVPEPPLPDLKSAKIQQVWQRYAAKKNDGITVGPYLIAANDEDRNMLTSQTTMIQTALSLNQLTSESMVTFAEKSGTTHTVTVGNYMMIVLGYGQAYEALWAEAKTLEGQIRAAETKEELEAISLPE